MKGSVPSVDVLGIKNRFCRRRFTKIIMVVHFIIRIHVEGDVTIFPCLVGGVRDIDGVGCNETSIEWICEAMSVAKKSRWIEQLNPKEIQDKHGISSEG